MWGARRHCVSECFDEGFLLHSREHRSVDCEASCGHIGNRGRRRMDVIHDLPPLRRGDALERWRLQVSKQGGDSAICADGPLNYQH